MFRVPLVTSDNEINAENFWNSVFLFHTSPHLVNRRILGVSQLFFLEVRIKNDVYSVSDILKYSELFSQVHRLNSITAETVNESLITNIFYQYGDSFKCTLRDLTYVQCSKERVFVSVRILFPRSMKSKKCLECVILDKENNIATFIAISDCTKIALSPNFAFDIELDKAKLMKISVNDIETAEGKASEWLADILFPKLLAWTEIRDTPVQKSLALVAVDKYCQLYQDLKLKYGENIVKNWPENTDPLKFVYEDVAIAAYLLLLWQRSSLNKQRFVDLGCGNGLLVHILSQEGHLGYGVDVRARKIWSMYPDTTKLRIQTIIPSTECLFPEADWIIGNHSDELTPWIPVIAARSSQTCNYFVLPCCSYEFDGSKYQRTNSSQSQYHEYLNYVKQISKTCGFKTEIDRLRIPSTKRICVVGTTREYDNFNIVDRQITELIKSKCTVNKTNNGKWIDNYEARQGTEQVRNCTKLDKTLMENIVKRIVEHLLSQENFITTLCGKQWNAGAVMALADLVKIVPSEQLKELKKNCGGLQTLLKNHHYIFEVKNGKVQLRVPVVNANKSVKQKTRECFFHKRHPDGCTLTAECCSYVHC